MFPTEVSPFSNLLHGVCRHDAQFVRMIIKGEKDLIEMTSTEKQKCLFWLLRKKEKVGDRAGRINPMKRLDVAAPIVESDSRLEHAKFMNERDPQRVFSVTALCQFA